MINLRIIKCLAASVLISALCLAQESFQDGMLNMEKLVLTSRDITKLEYPDADYVLVDDSIVTTYDTEGRYVTWDDTAIKILTEKGRQSNSVLSEYFCQSYSKTEVIRLQIISPDGKVKELDVKKLSNTMIDTEQMNSNIYDPNNKILKIIIPGLQVNDIIRYIIRRETFKPRVPKTFSDYSVMEYTSPIHRYSLEIRAPKELPLTNIALLSPVAGTVKYSSETNENGIIHRWVASKVPQAFSEPKMPKLYTCVQRLLVSTIPSWKDVSKWYWNLCLPHLTTNKDIETKVNELCAGQKDDNAKIRAIFKFVSQEIRYMGETTETEAPGYEPHDVIQTFSKRHGVCRDKAVLLAAMLRCAGFQAFPVLINAGPLKDKEVPQPYFNHAITAVKLHNNYMLMDSTDENTIDIFPAYLGHKSYLVATPEGEDLNISPVIPARNNLMSITTHCDIDANGDMKGTCAMKFLGINDNAYRSAFAKQTPNENKVMLETLTERIIPGADVTRIDIKPENVMDTETPLTVELSFSASSFLGGNDRLAFMPIPLFSKGFGMTNFILGDVSLDKRRFPFTCDFPCENEETLTMTIAPNWGIPQNLPEIIPIESPNLDWSKSITFVDDTLTVKTNYAIKTVQFSPQDYLILKNNLKKIEANNQKIPIFDKTIPRDAAAKAFEPDFIILEDSSDYIITAQDQWSETCTVKMQILSYNGKKEFSELSFGFHPDYDTAKLEYARVHNGSKCQELNLTDIKIMDAPWSASAPRYPRHKKLIANLPGVEVGSIIEYKYVFTSKGRSIFSEIKSFMGFGPIRKKRISISAQSGVKLYTNVSQHGLLMPEKDGESIHEEITENNGCTTYTWTAENMNPISRDYNMPRLRFFLPVVMASTGDWSQWADMVFTALESKTQPGPEILKTAAKLEDLSPLSKVRAIRNLVAKNIRSAGPLFSSLPLAAITPAEQTMTDAYGHSADRAVLIYSLLKAVGLKPEFVLAAGNKRSPGTSSKLINHLEPGVFGNVLVKVKAEGLTVWLNDSDQYAELGTCSFEGNPSLSMDGKIRDILVPDNYKTKQDIATIIRLFPNGDARFETSTSFYGADYAAYKKLFKQQTPEDRKRYILKKLSEISKSAVADGDFIIDFDKYPGVVSFNASVPDFASTQGDFLYASITNPFARLISVRGDRRTLPYESKISAMGKNEITIFRPDDFPKVAFTPSSQKIKLPEKQGVLTLKSKVDSEIANFVFSYDVKPFFIMPEEYQKLLDLSKLLRHPNFSKIIFEKNK